MGRPVRDWRERLAWELRAARRLTVLGVGNPDRGDDGAGSLCIRRLARAQRRSASLTCQGQRTAGAKPFPGADPMSGRCFAPSHDALLRSVPRGPRLDEIQILDGGEVPESVTGPIRGFGPTHVLIIDAAAGGHEPGTIFFINKNRILEDDLTTHRIPLSHLVRYLIDSIGCRVILLGIEPATTAPGAAMSAGVTAAVAALVSVLVNSLPKR